ncbi:hypothetical protein SCHPADRAFT_162814 [Schizopora paradoxa]|uniref:F-box domain-containing protein n=1 Tax=Schizopora paradoxa TaxID=27342 RepID=A0A0H2RZG4_9AGAM|nr:hypothetical protein SCHPADRAFT_162814 [Schizopora paradoxa]
MEEGFSNEPWMIPPLSFSLVCRSWRALVLSRPKLWSEMLVDLRFEPDENYRGPPIPQILKKWLNLSNPATLWIRLFLKGDGRGYITESILPLFLSECHRWGFAFVDVAPGWSTGIPPFEPTAFTVPCFPPLTHLSLTVQGVSAQTGYADLSQYVSENGSHLESLKVGRGASVRLPQSRDALQLPRLLSLYFQSSDEGGNLEDIRTILCASPNLEGMDLYLFTVNYILDLLICPCLLQLKLYIQRSFRETEITENSAFLEPLRIQDFLARSSSGRTPPLEHLTLEWFGYNATAFPNHAFALKRLLVFLKNLKTLKLHDNALNRAVIELLHFRNGVIDGTQPCPLVSEMELTYEAMNRCGFSELMVEDLIVNRWKAGHLRKASLRFSTPHLTHLGLKERERIKQCIQEGLVFEY